MNKLAAILFAFTIFGCAYNPKITSVAPLEREGNLRELEQITFAFYKGDIPTRKAAEEASSRLIRKILSEKKIGDLRLGYWEWSPSPPLEMPDFTSTGSSWTVGASDPRYATIKQSIREAGLWTDDPGGLMLTIRVERRTAHPRALDPPPPNIHVPPGLLLGSQLGYLSSLGTYYKFSLHVANYDTKSPGEGFLPKELIERIKSLVK